jgi:hypothetical protein
MKGIIFSGCSFTWGEGLHYYSDTKNLIFSKNQFFDIREYSDSHIKFKDANRFARLVANYFNSWEIVNAYNGGGISTNIDSLQRKFGIEPYNSLYEIRHDINDISAIVFQITDPLRGPFYVESKKIKNKIYSFNTLNMNDISSNNSMLLEACEEFGVENFEQILIEQHYEKIKKFLSYFESKNIVTKIICWQKSVAEDFLKYKFLKDRWITFDYKNQNMYSFEELYNNNHLFNNQGYFWKKYKVQFNDLHLSTFGHKAVAEFIIKNLENDIDFIKVHYNVTNNNFNKMQIFDGIEFGKKRNKLI